MKRTKVGSKIEQYKKELETLTLRMQFFHLDPQYNHFKEIINHKKLCSEQAHVIDWWKTACLIEYGDEWAKTYDMKDFWINGLGVDNSGFSDLSGFSVEKTGILQKYTKDTTDLIKKHDKRPTPTSLDQIWYLFFASGDYKYLKIGFETAGNMAASMGLRDDALRMFEGIREQYMEKIREAKERDSAYFANHDMPNTRNAEARWLELDKEIQSKMQQLDDEKVDDSDIDRLIAAEQKYKFVPDAEIGKTPEEIEHQKILDRGAEVFNKILSNLNNP